MALPEGTVEADVRQAGTGYFYIGNTIMLERLYLIQPYTCGDEDKFCEIVCNH